MRYIFDITTKNYLQFFNRISKILYSESTGLEKHMLRTIFSKVIDHDRYISRLAFDKDIFTEDNLISKYCFFDKDEDDNIIKEYRVYIMNDIPFKHDKANVSINMNRAYMKGDISKVYIFIHKRLCSELTSLEEKYNSIKYIFRRNLIYEMLSGICITCGNDYNIMKYIDIVSSVLSGLLVDYHIEDEYISDAINNILSSELLLIKGVSEIRLNLTFADDIFSLINTIFDIKFEKGFSEQG